MHSKEKGDLSEVIVIPKLMEHGYTVSRPFSENSRYDVIVDDGNLHRIQIKTGRLKEGSIRFNCCDSRHNTSVYTKKYYGKEDIDAFIVYCYETNGAYWLPIEETPRTEMWLRVDDISDKYTSESRINWAEDYEI